MSQLMLNVLHFFSISQFFWNWESLSWFREVSSWKLLMLEQDFCFFLSLDHQHQGLKACAEWQKWTQLPSTLREMNWQFVLSTVHATQLKWTELHWHISVQFVCLVRSCRCNWTGISVQFCPFVHAFTGCFVLRYGEDIYFRFTWSHCYGSCAGCRLTANHVQVGCTDV